MAADRGSRADRGATQWAQRLGEQRRAHDDCARRAVKAEEDAAIRTNAVSLQRWQAIVACIRNLIDAYNAGANRVVLSVLAEPGQPAITVRAGDEHAPYLTAMLDHALI